MLKVCNITKQFEGLTANDNISFEIRPNEIYGLIGPNGAGKTTLFNIIGGLYKPTSGKIYFCNEEIQNLSSNEIAYKGITRTFQNLNIFKNMTVLENIMVGFHTKNNSSLIDVLLKTKRSKIENERLMENCNKVLNYLNIKHLSDIKANQLPYGDQKKVEIARALVSNPKLLLLDEPVAGMNQSEKNEITEIIMNIKATGITILLVEHNMKLIMSCCDRICVINHGSKIAEGTPIEIQNNQKVINAYLGGNTNETIIRN